MHFLKWCLCDLKFSSLSFHLQFIHSFLYGSVKELLPILSLVSYFELRYLVSSVIQHCLMIHCSASFGIMHQIPVGSFAAPLFWFEVCFHPHGSSQQTQQTILFLSWAFHVGSGAWRGCKSRSTGMFSKVEMHMQAGIIWGFMDTNELCLSPRQFSQHLTMSALYFGHCSVLVPWLLWLLCCVTSLPCHHPCSQFLLISLLLCLLIWAIYTPSQGYLW